MPEFFLQLCK